jgi:hypothetical protein
MPLLEAVGTLNADNRTQQTIGGTTTSFAYNAANQLCGPSCSSPTYSYDGNGKLTSSSSPASSFTYNTANQTTAITAAGTTLSAIGYADVGQAERTAVTSGSTTTHFLSGPLGLDKSSTSAGSTYVVRDSAGNVLGFVDTGGNHWYGHPVHLVGVHTSRCRFRVAAVDGFRR